MFSLRALEPLWSFLSFYILHRLSGQQKRHNGESQSLIIALNKDPKAFQVFSSTGQKKKNLFRVSGGGGVFNLSGSSRAQNQGREQETRERPSGSHRR